MFRISTNHLLQSLNQTSEFRLILNSQTPKGDHSSIWFTIKAIVADHCPIPSNISYKPDEAPRVQIFGVGGITELRELALN